MKISNKNIKARKDVGLMPPRVFDDLKKEKSKFNLEKEEISTLNELNSLIEDWEEMIAESYNYDALIGHGTYRVSAANRMGLSLVAKYSDE